MLIESKILTVLKKAKVFGFEPLQINEKITETPTMHAQIIPTYPNQDNFSVMFMHVLYMTFKSNHP